MAEYILNLLFLLVLASFLWETKNWFSVIAVWFVFLGNVFNQIATMSNGGLMPVILPKGSEVLTLSVLASPRHTLADASTRFPLLVDWIDIPRLGHIASIGDVCIVLSLCWLLLYACHGIFTLFCTIVRERKLPENPFRISYTVCLSCILATYCVLFLEYVFN